MNTKTIVSVLLITLGIVVLAYSGLTFTTPGKPVDFLGMHIETTHSHFISPAIGALALVGGSVFLLRQPEPQPIQLQLPPTPVPTATAPP